MATTTQNKARFALEMSERDAEKLDQLAKEKKLTKAEVLRRALAMYAYLQKQQRDESAAVIVRSEKGEKEIVNF